MRDNTAAIRQARILHGIVLYGPPAAGKDTITRALAGADRRFVHFQRLKAGRGNSAGYRMTTRQHIAELRERHQLIWENERYESVYAIDRESLLHSLAGGVPIVHLGQPEAVTAVTMAVPNARWTVAELWCS